MTDETSTPAEGEKPEATPAPEEGEKPQAEEGEKPEAKTFDESYVNELKAEAIKNRKAAKAAEARLQEREDAEKSELEKAQAKVQRLEAEKAEIAAKNLRHEVASEKGVPGHLLTLLTATEREDLEAQADLIVENSKPKPTSMDGGVRDTAPEPKTPDEAHSDFLMNVFGKPSGGT